MLASMRWFAFVLCLMLPSWAAAEVSWPETKYAIGDCITPTNPDWSWFGKYAFVEDIIYSKSFDQFAYILWIEGRPGTHSIWSTENETSKLTKCPD